MSTTLQVFDLSGTEKRFSAIFWGLSGTGKTILASTGRRPILHLNWDIEGFVSVEDTKDFHVINFAEHTDDIVESFIKSSNRMFTTLEEIVKARNIRTVISDSITSYVARALTHAANIGNQYAKGKEQVSIYKPGFTGYGIRTTLLHQYIYNIGIFCSRLGLDCIFIGHEDQPKTIGEGDNQRILYATMRLGGDSGFEVPKDVREVWHFGSDEKGENYKISFRPFPVVVGSTALVRPMKSTMFDTTKIKSMNWTKGEDSLSTWINLWLQKGKQLTPEDFE